MNRAVALYNYDLAKKWFTWKNTSVMAICLWIFGVIFIIPSVLKVWGKTGFEEQIFRLFHVVNRELTSC